MKRAAIFLLAVAVHAGIAPTPPMGWNSWDCYGTAVTEDEVKANADYMAKHLAAHGWQYIVVDIQWYEPNAHAHNYRPGAELSMDSYGRLTPAVNRFPSSANGAGFKPLADYVHKLGLKFGIHIIRGIPRQAVRANTPVFGTNLHARDIADEHSICPWNPDMYGVDTGRGGAKYYSSLVNMYAQWGVDFIKADDMERPMHRGEVEALHRAIVDSGRNIVLSLSPGAARVEDAVFLGENANMWRVSDDFWDAWPLLRQNFTLLAIWGGMGRPGAWPDGDMLPFGSLRVASPLEDDRKSHFTPTEQQTVMTLWSIAQSPLIFGGDMPGNDDFTNSLLSNDEVIAVDQHGRHGREVFANGDKVYWTAEAPEPNTRYLAVFNIGDHGPTDVPVDWRAIGLGQKCRVRDLWKHEDLGVIENGNSFTVQPHASQLYKITTEK